MGLVEHTINTIIYEDVKICQPKAGQGFRFGCDSPILARFAKLKKSAKVIEAGAGSGVISILLSKFYGVKPIAIELQQYMYDCMIKSIELSNMTNAVTPILANIKDYRHAEKVDAVVCNPPYRHIGTGKHSVSETEKIARFTTHMNMDILCKFAKSNLKSGGRLYFSYDADMLVEAISVCKLNNLEPKRMQFLYPAINKQAKLVFVEATLNGGSEMKIEQPLIQNGTEEATKAYNTIFNK